MTSPASRPGRSSGSKGQLSGPTARGKEFERVIAQLLRSADFEVVENAKSAKPRQTDLFAKNDDVDLLIEAKDQKRKIDVDDIDSLRARLNRVSFDIVGIIFSTSGLTNGARQAIEADRTREILAVVEDEIELLRSGKLNLVALIKRKRYEIRVNGTAWFGLSLTTDFIDVKLPPAGAEFSISDDIHACLEAKGNFGGVFYALDIPDPGWGNLDNEGARLSIEVTPNSIRDLRDTIGHIHQKFGLSSRGGFVVRQSKTCWYGFGIENFLDQVEGWQDRYSRSGAGIFHHSEEAIYFDRFKNGWIEISLQHRLKWSGSSSASQLDRCGIVIQLPGLPVDMTPYVRLCERTGNEFAYFEHVAKRQTASLRLKKPIALTVKGIILNKGRAPADGEQGQIAVGVVAENPFFQNQSFPEEILNADAFNFRDLIDTEILLCALRDWHDISKVVDQYFLQGFDFTTGGTGQIVRPFGTWNRILD